VEADGKVISPAFRTGSYELADVYSKIHVADWNGDGLKDLLVGHNDRIILYKNIGSKSSPKLTAPVKINGNFPSRPSPYIVDWDHDGKNDLLVGSDEAKVFFYRNVGTNKEPKLAIGKQLILKGINPIGYRYRVAVTDWNNDGKLDLLVGNYYSEGTSRNGGNIWLFLGE